MGAPFLTDVMVSHTADILKGFAIHPERVDWAAQFDVTLGINNLSTFVYAGQIVRFDPTNHTYLLGVGNLKTMPMMLLANSWDPDVSYFGGDPSTNLNTAQNLGPAVLCGAPALVLNESAECLSTAYVPSSGAFNPNDPLTSPSTGANAGLITEATFYTNMIFGLVSQGITGNISGYNAVAFWTCLVFPNP